MALQKLEAEIVVPATTIGFRHNASVITYVAAGTYYWSSVHPSNTVSLLAALTTISAAQVVGSTVTIDATTGLLVFTRAPASTMNLANSTTAALFGFASTIIASATSTSGDYQPRALWRPNVNAGSMLGSYNSTGIRETDLVRDVARSGRVTVRQSNERTRQRLKFYGLTKAKTWAADESIRNESAESFWRQYVQGGAAVRHYLDRTDATSYRSNSAGVTTNRDYYVGGPNFDPVRVKENRDQTWVWDLDLAFYV